MKYDVLVVGAGISAATLCAVLKNRYRICVVDTRKHLGGNCFDYPSGKAFVHAYGPHIFHSPSRPVVDFLSRFTQWTHYNHTVIAEVEDQGHLRRVPFPYCRLTQEALGRTLSPAEIITLFFKDYSRKMWGRDYGDLPTSIQGRVPKDTQERPQYFPEQFQAVPTQGYTRMLERMFEGVELALNVDEDQWQSIPAERIVYCGRPDRIRMPGSTRRYAQVAGASLPFRSLQFRMTLEDWDAATTMVHFCHGRQAATRKTNYGYFYGDRSSRVVSYELPYEAPGDELAPYYPLPLPENCAACETLQRRIAPAFGHRLHFLGRLATYKYLDMFQAVGQALAMAQRVFSCVPAPLSPLPRRLIPGRFQPAVIVPVRRPPRAYAAALPVTPGI